VERSGERELHKNDGAERGAEGRGAGTERGAGGYRNGSERGATFTPLTLRSHALLAASDLGVVIDTRLTMDIPCCVGLSFTRYNLRQI